MASIPSITEVVTASNAAAATTLIVTIPSGGVPSGTDLLLAVAGSGAGTHSTTIDSRGNTWTVLFSAGGSGTGRTYILQCRVNIAMLAGDTTTITFSGSNFKTAGLYRVDNLAGFDVAAAGSNSASGTAVSSGAGTPSGPSRFGFFACGIYGSPTSFGSLSSGWSQAGITNLIAGAGSTVTDLACAYNLAVPAGSNTVTATLGVAQSWGAGFVTEKVVQDNAPRPHVIYMRRNR